MRLLLFLKHNTPSHTEHQEVADYIHGCKCECTWIVRSFGQITTKHLLQLRLENNCIQLNTDDSTMQKKKSWQLRTDRHAGLSFWLSAESNTLSRGWALEEADARLWIKGVDGKLWPDIVRAACLTVCNDQHTKSVPPSMSFFLGIPA